MICKVVVMTLTSLQVSNVSFKRHTLARPSSSEISCMQTSFCKLFSLTAHTGEFYNPLLLLQSHAETKCLVSSFPINYHQGITCMYSLTSHSGVRRPNLFQSTLTHYLCRCCCCYLPCRQFSPTQCKYFYRRFDRLEISSKNNKKSD